MAQLSALHTKRCPSSAICLAFLRSGKRFAIGAEHPGCAALCWPFRAVGRAIFDDSRAAKDCRETPGRSVIGIAGARMDFSDRVIRQDLERMRFVMIGSPCLVDLHEESAENPVFVQRPVDFVCGRRGGIFGRAGQSPVAGEDVPSPDLGGRGRGRRLRCVREARREQQRDRHGLAGSFHR